MPPPYSVATSLPTYDEAEKAKAAAMAASTVEVMPRVSTHTHTHACSFCSVCKNFKSKQLPELTNWSSMSAQVLS